MSKINPKNIIKNILARLNRKLIYVPPNVVSGADIRYDIQQLVRNKSPTIFDVGANVGQSIIYFRELFPSSVIYSFEPSASTYAQLHERYEGWEKVSLYNFAMGAALGNQTFVNYDSSCLNSFLNLDQKSENRFRGCSIKYKEEVAVNTIDNFLEEKNIDFVELLKIDTQGYDLEVLKGSGNALENAKVGVVVIEVNMVAMYEQGAAMVDIFNYLNHKSYYLVDLYEKERFDQTIAWCNAIFKYRHSI